jgi:hypothetical protein
MWVMVKRRALQKGSKYAFRESEITNFLRSGGSRDKAQRIAAHKDVLTAASYD